MSVSKWTTDTASAVRLEDCRSETFLISVQQEAVLNGTLSSENCTGTAGTLVSRGPVKLRILTQLALSLRFCCSSRFKGGLESQSQEASAVDLLHALPAKEMSSLTRLVRRK